MWKKLAPVIILLLITVPAVSALEWEFKNTQTFPEQVSNNSEMVFITQLTVDDDGDTVDYIKPTRCDSLDTVLSYGGNVEDMTFIDGSDGYFYGTTTSDTSDKTISITANGNGCNPLSGEANSQIRIFSKPPSETLITDSLEERFELEGLDTGSISDTGLTTVGETGTEGIRNTNAYFFNGDTTYLEVETDGFPSETLEEYTITAWIRPETEGGTVYAKNDENYTSGLKLGIDGSTPTFSLYGEEDGLQVENQISVGESISTGKWHHIAGTVQKTEDGEYNMSIYFDREMSSLPTSSFEKYNHTSNRPVVGAASNGSAGKKDFFEGSIDEVRFYSRALNKEELEELTDSAFAGFYEADINRSKDLFLETETDAFRFNGDLSSLKEDYGEASASWESLDYLGNTAGAPEFSVPSNPESLYIMKLTDNPTDIYPAFANEEGEAVPITIKQKIQGSINFEHDGEKCSSDVSKCEKGSNVTVLVEETQSSAENVSVYINDDEGNRVDSFNATRKNVTYWSGSFEIPETTNSSYFTTEAILKNDYSSDTVTDSIETNPFTMNVNSDTDYELRGNEISLQAYPMTPYTSELYPLKSITEAVFTVYGPENSQIHQESITDDIANYYNSKQGMISYNYRIPLEAEHGEYSFETSLTDSSGFERTSKRHSFTVRNVSIQPSDVQIKDISSSISEQDGVESITKDFVGVGNKDGNILVKNHGDVKGDVMVNFTGDLKDIGTVTEVNNGGTSPFTLHPSSQAVVDVEFDFPETGTYTGAITFNVTGELDSYSRRVEANFSVEAACSIQQGSICLMDESVSEEIFSEDSSIGIELKNQESNELSLDYSTSGNLTSVVDTGTVSIGGKEEETVDIPVSVTAADNGYYEGEIEFVDGSNRASIPVKLDVGIPVGSLELDMSETDLGTLVSGDTASFEYTVTNTGDVGFEWVRIRGSEGGISNYIEDDSGNRLEISPGSSESGEIEIDSSRLSPGDYTEDDSIEITAKSDTSARDSSEISLKVVEDLSDDIDSMSSTITSIESEIESLETNTSEFESRLSELRNLATTAKARWDSGEYESAKKTLNTLEEDAEHLRSDVSASKSSSESSDGGSGTSGTDETSESGGGFFSIWVLIVPLLFLMIIGAVLYLSIVPEE